MIPQHIVQQDVLVIVTIGGPYSVGSSAEEAFDSFSKLLRCAVHEQRITYKQTSASDKLFLDFCSQSVLSILVNKTPLTPSEVCSPERLKLPLSVQKTDGDTIIEVWYENRYAKMGEQGLIKFVDTSTAEETQFTHFEPYDAHMVFPCFDQPDIKATWIVSTITPTEWFVISNEDVETKTETTSSAPLELGQVFPQTTLSQPMTLRTFKKSSLISTYLFAVAAGPFTVFSDKYQGVPLRILVRNSCVYYIETKVAALFDATKKGFKFFEHFFNVKYAFSKYDQVFVPGMLFGGMENVGCVTLSEMALKHTAMGHTKFGYDTLVYSILHELCHHWFGDLVTLKWWEDLWLNEGFASFMGYYCIEKGEGFENDRLSVLQFYMQKYIAYGTDERKAGHPIVMKMEKTGSTKDLFDNITYNKGAAVLKQLLNIVGETAFRDGMHLYLEKYKFSNANLGDMLNCIHSASQAHNVPVDIPYWAEQWLHTAGANVFLPVFTVEEDTITEFIVQQISIGNVDEYYRTHLMDIALIYGETVAIEVIKDVLVEPTEYTLIDKITGKPAPSAVILNYNDKTYGITQIDKESLKYLKQHIHKLADPYARYLIAFSCSRMFTNGLISAEDYQVFHPYLGLI